MASSVELARPIFAAMGTLTLLSVVYTMITAGSPFPRSFHTPWMNSTVVDFYVSIAVISTWVCYKEKTWMGALFWVILFISLGSIATCWYITIQLFKLKSSDPLYLVLLKDEHVRKP